MTKEPPKKTYRVEDILKAMEPGTYYTLPEIMQRAALSTSVVKALLVEAENCRWIECVRKGSRNLYGLISEEARRQPATLHVCGELKGYDEQLKQFREICEATRKRS